MDIFKGGKKYVSFARFRSVHLVSFLSDSFLKASHYLLTTSDMDMVIHTSV